MTSKEKHLRVLLGQQIQKRDNVNKVIAELDGAIQQAIKDTIRVNPPPVVIKNELLDNYCGKICYPSKKTANIDKRKINSDLKSNNRKRNKPALQRAYFCEQCSAWHLTTIALYTTSPIKPTKP